LTSRAKQTLANQNQRPLDLTSLATADKDADHFVLVSQFELLLLQDSIFPAHMLHVIHVFYISVSFTTFLSTANVASLSPAGIRCSELAAVP
jgi:hypothetical protein